MLAEQFGLFNSRRLVLVQEQWSRHWMGWLERWDRWEWWYRWKEHHSVSQSASNRRDAGCRRTTLMRWSIYMEIHSTASGWHVIGSTVCFKHKISKMRRGVFYLMKEQWWLRIGIKSGKGKKEWTGEYFSITRRQCFSYGFLSDAHNPYKGIVTIAYTYMI